MRTTLALVAFTWVALFPPTTAQANSCDPPRQIGVRGACGRVLATNGEPVPDLEVGVLSAEGNPVASTVTDASGNFNLPNIEPGTYQLYSKSKFWDEIRWPVKFSNAKGKKCDHPLYMVLSPKSGMDCVSWVTKKKPDLK